MLRLLATLKIKMFCRTSRSSGCEIEKATLGRTCNSEISLSREAKERLSNMRKPRC